MTDAVLGNTYGLEAADFAKIRRDTTDRKLASRVGDPVVPSTAGYRDPHKLAVENLNPSAQITGGAGTVKTARTQFWPALKDLSMYSLRLREDGMREPHWHPTTAELGYVHSRSARMTVMDPDGTLDTWYMKQGDVYFVPRAYPHHIEVFDAPTCILRSSSTSPHPGISATAPRRAPIRAKCWRRRSTPISMICPTSRSPRRTRCSFPAAIRSIPTAPGNDPSTATGPGAEYFDQVEPARGG